MCFGGTHMTISTGDLMRRILNMKDLEELSEEISKQQKDQNLYRDWGDYLQELLDKKTVSVSELAASVSTFYPVSDKTIYSWLRGNRKPLRENLIRIGFALNLSLDELNTLLKLAGHKELYSKNKADSIIMWCIDKRKGPEVAQEMLNKHHIKSIAIFSPEE